MNIYELGELLGKIYLIHLKTHYNKINKPLDLLNLHKEIFKIHNELFKNKKSLFIRLFRR